MRSICISACVTLAVALALPGCGGGSSDGNRNPNNPTPPPGASATINIVGDRGGQSFSPNPASVDQGETVSWRNNDSVTHRIVLNDGSLDTGVIAPGASSPALSLPTNGARYHCTIHPTMVGSINNASGTPPDCTGPYC